MRLTAPILVFAVGALTPAFARAQLTTPQPPSSSAPQSTAQAAPRPLRAPTPPGRDTVFLDPAHGGDDTGAHLRDGALEKDVDLAFAERLRAQLTSLGLDVLLSRDSDQLPAPAPQLPTPDQRAGLANHVHPFACIILHATDSGAGVHVITADLQQPSSSDPSPSSATPLDWDSAQLDHLPESQHLASLLTDSLAHSGLSPSRGRAVIRPLISLTCPAVVIELAPLSHSTSPGNSNYQARAAQAIATTLLLWHTQTQPAQTSQPAP